MELSTAQPIRLDRLQRAFTSFIDLNYLELAEGQTFLDSQWHEYHEAAVHDFKKHLEDEDADQEVRRALSWLLNQPADRFSDYARQLTIPYPRFDAPDIHRFLELLWFRTWEHDWRVKDFVPNAYELIVKPPGQ